MTRRVQSAGTISRRMAAVRSTNTGPERIVRAHVHAMGVRFRLRNKDLPGSPDLANRKRRWAIFVHGCFWHGHDCARGARVPKANRDYWVGKVARNRARDVASRAALEAAGWRVETVWECELKDASALEARVRDWLARQSAVRTPPGAS